MDGHAQTSEQMVQEIQRSHIEANVPPAEEFDALLRRDLSAYFSTVPVSSLSVSYELLRDGPTQSGVAFPKYYMWVRVVGPPQPREGALSAAAIDRTHFEVYDFMSATDIRSTPEALRKVFPAMLVPLILSKAGVR
jgi:hypothetical protein